MTGIRVTGWGIAVPDKVVTNDDLAVRLDTSDDWIVERTGIRERRIGGTTSGLAIEAALCAAPGPQTWQFARMLQLLGQSRTVVPLPLDGEQRGG